MDGKLAMPLLGLLVFAGMLLWLLDTPQVRPAPPAREGTSSHAEQAPILLGTERARPEVSPPAEREAASETARPSDDEVLPPFVVRGRVFDASTGAALARAEVRAHVGNDTWGLRSNDDSVVRTRTAADGRYELSFPLPNGDKQLVLTALARGYRSAHAWPEGAEEGEVEGGPADTRLLAAPGDTGTLDMALLPGLDVGGVVVDGAGRPVPDVQIVVSRNTESSTAYIEFPWTDAQGRFRVHDLPTLPHHRPGSRGTLDFDHPEHQAARVEDVYALPASERAALRIVMPKGLTLAGTLRHANGDPAVDVLVAAYAGESNTGRRGVRTDAEGRFALRGLTPGPLVVRAHSGTRLSFLRRELTLRRDEEDLDLRLAQAPLARASPREQVLGLEVVALSPEARKEFDLYEQHALLVTGIAGLVPAGLSEHVRVGDVLWHVGGISCTSARDVMRGVVKRADWWTKMRPGEEASRYSVRYVLGIRRPDIDGTYTGSMEVPAHVVESLRQFLAAHPESADDE